MILFPLLIKVKIIRIYDFHLNLGSIRAFNNSISCLCNNLFSHVTLYMQVLDLIGNKRWRLQINEQWARFALNGSKVNNSKKFDFREKIVKHEIIIYAKYKSLKN